MLEADYAEGFDLKRAPLFRLTLARASHDACYFLLSHPHIILDGWSMALLLKDVMTAYQAAVAGTLDAWPVAPAFREHIRWLKQAELDLEVAETIYKELPDAPGPPAKPRSVGFQQSDLRTSDDA